MEAGNEGHKSHDGPARSIGLTIELPFEAEGNEHLDIERHFPKFSGRLDQFMRLSNVVVVMPGGIGTCLELFYTWQLIQVGHICNIPIILYGDMWQKLVEWVRSYPLEKGLISPKDMDMVCVAKSPEDILKIVDEAHEGFKNAGKDYCLNVKKYQYPSSHNEKITIWCHRSRSYGTKPGSKRR